MMIRRIVIIALTLISTFNLYAQRDIYEGDGWSIKDRGYLGVGLGGLALGSNSIYGNYFSIGVSALSGYMLTKNLSTGIGFEYQYTNYSDLDIQDHVYGGYPFLRYNVWQFFVQTDYDFYSIKVSRDNTSDREIFERFFIGLGYSSGGGQRARMNFLVSYDLLYTNTSVFSSPLSTRAFITF